MCMRERGEGGKGAEAVERVGSLRTTRERKPGDSVWQRRAGRGE